MYTRTIVATPAPRKACAASQDLIEFENIINDDDASCTSIRTSRASNIRRVALSAEEKEEMHREHERDNAAARPWRALLAEFADVNDRQYFVSLVLHRAEGALRHRVSIHPRRISTEFFSFIPNFEGDREQIEQLGAMVEFALNTPSTQDQTISLIRSTERELSALQLSAVVLSDGGSDASSLSSSDDDTRRAVANVAAIAHPPPLRAAAAVAQEPLPAAQRPYPRIDPVNDLVALAGNEGSVNIDSDSDSGSRTTVGLRLEEDS